jgi:hypothetical protein
MPSYAVWDHEMVNCLDPTPGLGIGTYICGKRMRSLSETRALFPPYFHPSVISRDSAGMEVAWEWASFYTPGVLLQGLAVNRVSVLY